MAATLGVTHPQVFRAVGIHSGLPHGCAHDVVSAFAAMRGDGRPAKAVNVPAIVFHGTADATVSAANAARILGPTTGADVATGHANGRSWKRRVADGSELWLIEDAGLAWSGGSRSGSYADSSGPDASAKMVRFFLAAL